MLALLTRLRLLALPFSLLGASSLNIGCKSTPNEQQSSRQHSEKLPVLGELPGFELLDQNAQTSSPEKMRGTPWVAAFMFTRCPSICPRITQRMSELDRHAQKLNQALKLVSISVDPEHDTPEVLRAYADKYKIDTSRWSLWTGPYQVIAETAEKGFKIGLAGKATEGAEHLGITHGSHLVLIDREGKIRGYYRSFDDDVVIRLTADLARL